MNDILVHLDGSAEDETRLSYAEGLASASDLHVTGLFTNPLPLPVALGSPDDGGASALLYAELDQEARERGAQVKARLVERLDRMAATTDVAELDLVSIDMAAAVVSAARASDLFIATTPYRTKNDEDDWDALIEAVIFGSGRGTLLVPPGQKLRGPFRRIVIGWRDTRESAVAMAQVLPFLSATTQVDIVLVDADLDDGAAPAAGIARHLARHGATTQVKLVKSGPGTVADALLEQAARSSADLLVLGAYGHSRLREWILGGTTRDILATATLPVLTAH